MARKKRKHDIVHRELEKLVQNIEREVDPREFENEDEYFDDLALREMADMEAEFHFRHREAEFEW